MSEKSYSIDVIIPVYNCERYILKAIASIERQTLKPNSIIVVNDESNDSTLLTIENYHCSIPLRIINKKNNGVGAARNTGIKESKSDFIALLDADDEWDPEKLEKQVDILIHTDVVNCGVVYAMFRVIDEHGMPLQSQIPLLKPEGRHNVYPYLLHGGSVHGSASAVLIKRSLFEDVGYFDENGAGGEDSDMWLRLSTIAGFDYCSEPLVSIRRHSANAQRNKVLMFRYRLYFLEKWVSAHGDKYLHRRWGRSVMLENILKLPDLRFFKLTMELSKSTKREIFSIQLAGLVLYKLGLVLTIVEAMCLFINKVVKYVFKHIKNCFFSQN